MTPSHDSSTKRKDWQPSQTSCVSQEPTQKWESSKGPPSSPYNSFHNQKPHHNSHFQSRHKALLSNSPIHRYN
ncbi:hypothetical protein SISSUDRAFT_318876 [Sistotremastrum suecicum HHB10207 ss-3]|uniref:Uncharacterized protein n=1 Tax=Sistotremastrum suecicum HHB10207 ss-3 TaxID=1314776 RepID=A0A166IPX7_9AGAM|nr:hypothetical protein SISSUDRAFT_318876 [Sistotremastrum suecicum HHB10207 ss-3]